MFGKCSHILPSRMLSTTFQPHWCYSGSTRNQTMVKYLVYGDKVVRMYPYFRGLAPSNTTWACLNPCYKNQHDLCSCLARIHPYNYEPRCYIHCRWTGCTVWVQSAYSNVHFILLLSNITVYCNQWTDDTALCVYMYHVNADNLCCLYYVCQVRSVRYVMPSVKSVCLSVCLSVC